jgi:hypothetical protein
MDTISKLRLNTFGDISMSESTGTLTAKGNWQDLEFSWQIKMYPTVPNSATPLDLPSQKLSSDVLLSPFEHKIGVNS